MAFHSCAYHSLALSPPSSQPPSSTSSSQYFIFHWNVYCMFFSLFFGSKWTRNGYEMDVRQRHGALWLPLDSQCNVIERWLKCVCGSLLSVFRSPRSRFILPLKYLGIIAIHILGMNMAIFEEAVVNGDAGRNHSNSMNWNRNEAPTKLARTHIYLCITTSYKYWKMCTLQRWTGGWRVLGLGAIKYVTLTHTTGAFNGSFNNGPIIIHITFSSLWCVGCGTNRLLHSQYSYISPSECSFQQIIMMPFSFK